MPLAGNIVENNVKDSAPYVSLIKLVATAPLGRALRTPTREERAAWNDEELLLRLLQYQDAAWEEFIRRFQLMIFSCIDRVTRPFNATVSHTDREDIYAQLLYSLQARDMHRLRAYRIEHGIRLSTWIGVLTRNVTWDYLRKLPRRHQTDALNAYVEGQAEYAEDPERTFERKQKAQQTVAILEMLSPRDRTFVQLFYIEKLEPEAIASAMSISVKTVYSKKHKLHNKLQQLGVQHTKLPDMSTQPTVISANVAETSLHIAVSRTERTTEKTLADGRASAQPGTPHASDVDHG